MLSYLIIFFAWLLILFFVGHLLSRYGADAPNTGFYPTVLRNIFTGYVVVISVHAIIQTEFKTINIVLLLIGALICFEVRKNKTIRDSPRLQFKIKQLATLVIAAILLFLIPWLTISNNDSLLKFFYHETDYTLYSRIAQSLLVHGHENGFTILNELDPVYYNNPEPYHFFDIWGAATISRAFSVNPFPGLVTIVYPTFYFLAFAGYMALFKKEQAWTAVCAFVLLLVGGITLTFIDHSFFQSHTNLSFDLLTPKIYKLSYFYVFLISAFLLYRAGYTTIAVLVCVALPAANIITFPTIVPSLFGFLAIMYIRSPARRTEVTRNFIYTALAAIAIVGFYFLNQRQSAGLAGAEISKPLELIQGIIDPLELATRRNIIVGGILSIAIMYAPFIIVIALHRRQYSKTVLGLVPGIIITAGLLVWSILFQELNSSQIFSNISIVVVNLSIAIILSEIINNYPTVRPSRAVIAITAILLIGAVGFQVSRDVSKAGKLQVTSHSDDYLRKIGELTTPNSVVASIRSAGEMTSPFMKYNAVYPLGEYLLLQDKGCFAVNISDLSTPIDSTSNISATRSMKAIRDGLFYRYSKLPKNAALSEHELMEQFVDEFSIRFLIVSKNAVLPTKFMERAKEIVTDPLSGEQFIELSKQ